MKEACDGIERDGLIPSVLAGDVASSAAYATVTFDCRLGNRILVEVGLPDEGEYESKRLKQAKTDRIVKRGEKRNDYKSDSIIIPKNIYMCK